MTHHETLSPAQARKLVLHSQRLPVMPATGSALATTQAALDHLGYIQIDTISVIERAHHHTLWNRNPAYQTDHINQLVVNKTAFEYWSHAAAYLPMCDYRYSLPRKQAFKSGQQAHWYQRDEKLIKWVHERIRAEGPLMAKDFQHDGPKTRDWGSKPAKQALEYLFMQGDLMIPHRHNFHKVYDLTERVLPVGINTTLPETNEYIRFLIRRYLNSNGLGQAAEISYLLKGIKPTVTAVLKDMLEEGELIIIQVGEINYYTRPELLKLLDQPLKRSKAKILSPFDNLLIQRQRVRDLFDFDYQFEAYVPAAKRKFGYFALPVLWDGRLVARMDCKAERKHKELQIISLHQEPWLRKVDEFKTALQTTLHEFMLFNGCETLRYL